MDRLFKIAIRGGVTNVVQLYIAKGVDLNGQDDCGMSPLMYAAAAGHTQVCRVLLEAGADPRQSNDEGRDAQFFALRNGSSEVVSLLAQSLDSRVNGLEKTHSFSTLESFGSEHQWHDGEGVDISGWEEFRDSPLPNEDPTVDSTVGVVQRLISSHRAAETDEDWSEIEVYLPSVENFRSSSSECHFQTGNVIGARPRMYILEVGATYLTCFPEVFGKYQTILNESATLSNSNVNSLLSCIQADVDSLNNSEPGRQTVWSVVEAMVSRQQDFLVNGPKHLKPMMIRDIADEVGINNSTVSRIVNRIWAHTPQGIIHLRRMFSGSILNEEGEEISTQAIKQRVKELLIAEVTPITDDQIVARLRTENIKISRRTVAKYRQQLAILGSRERAKGSKVGGVLQKTGENLSAPKSKVSSKESERDFLAQDRKPRKKHIQEMGERHFREAEEAIASGEYDRALGLFSATILCGYRTAESFYQFGRAELEIVNRRIPRISPVEYQADEDLKHRVKSAINSFSRAIRLEPNLLDAHFYLSIAYALLGDKKSAFIQKAVLEGLDSPAAEKLTLSLDFILSRRIPP